MTSYSQDFTVKSNARRAARKAGIDPSTVTTVVKAGTKLYRYPLGDSAAEAKTLAREVNEAAAKKIAKTAKKTKPAKKGAKKAKAPKAAKTTKAKTDAPKGERGLKFIAVAALLRRPGGASITEVCAATGWKPHSARARISVDVSKLLVRGEDIQRRREDGVSQYAIVNSMQMELPGVSQEAA